MSRQVCLRDVARAVLNGMREELPNSRPSGYKLRPNSQHSRTFSDPASFEANAFNLRFVLANACVTASVTTTISIADAELRRQSAEVAQRIAAGVQAAASSLRSSGRTGKRQREPAVICAVAMLSAMFRTTVQKPG